MGTTVKNVIGFGDGFEGVEGRRNGAAKRSQTAVALNGKRNSIEDPAKRGVRIAFMVPWIW